VLTRAWQMVVIAAAPRLGLPTKASCRRARASYRSSPVSGLDRGQEPGGPCHGAAIRADGKAGHDRNRQPAGNDLGLVALSLLQSGSVAVATQAAASIPIDRLNASNDE
jgi:hypothetical protein